MKTQKTEKFARVIVGLMILVILTNIYLFATITDSVSEGDEIILLAWAEGDSRVTILAWQDWHLAEFSTSQFVWQWVEPDGESKVRQLGYQPNNMPYGYFGPDTRWPTNHHPGRYGSFLFPISWEGFPPIHASEIGITIPSAWNGLPRVRIHSYVEVDDSITTQAIEIFTPTSEELWLNAMVQEYPWRDDLSTPADPRWDPSRDCRYLAYYHTDVAPLPDNVFDRVDQICAGAWDWFE